MTPRILILEWLPDLVLIGIGLYLLGAAMIAPLRGNWGRCVALSDSPSPKNRLSRKMCSSSPPCGDCSASCGGPSMPKERAAGGGLC
jgi:hypothetical protein